MLAQSHYSRLLVCLRRTGAPELAAGGVSWAVNERQAEALVRAHEALMRCGQAMAEQAPMDCWTIDLRGAIMSLGEVCGEEVTEEVLDNVFSRWVLLVCMAGQWCCMTLCSMACF